jgi:hypothetical protein
VPRLRGRDALCARERDTELFHNPRRGPDLARQFRAKFALDHGARLRRRRRAIRLRHWRIGHHPRLAWLRIRFIGRRRNADVFVRGKLRIARLFVDAIEGLNEQGRISP